MNFTTDLIGMEPGIMDMYYRKCFGSLTGGVRETRDKLQFAQTRSWLVLISRIKLKIQVWMNDNGRLDLPEYLLYLSASSASPSEPLYLIAYLLISQLSLFFRVPLRRRGRHASRLYRPAVIQTWASVACRSVRNSNLLSFSGKLAHA